MLAESFTPYFLCRAINSLLLVLLFQRRDLFRMILFLLHPKPPRLRKVRMEMMLKTC
jgi:hypothetical protein